MPRWAHGVVALWLAGARYRGPLSAPPLPCTGAMGEQPAALLEALMLIDVWSRPKDGAA